MTLNLVTWWLEPRCWVSERGSKHFGTSSLWAFLVCAVVDQVTSQREDWRYMIHLRADLKKQWKYMFGFFHLWAFFHCSPITGELCYRPLLYFWYILYIHTHLSTSQHSTGVYIMRTTFVGSQNQLEKARFRAVSTRFPSSCYPVYLSIPSSCVCSVM